MKYHLEISVYANQPIEYTGSTLWHVLNVHCVTVKHPSVALDWQISNENYYFYGDFIAHTDTHTQAHTLPPLHLYICFD